MLCSSVLLTTISMWTAVLFVAGQVEGKRMLCYECSTETSGHTCLYSPENVTQNVVRCRHYCTIQRKEYADIPGTISIASLTRGCEKEPEIFDGVVMSGWHITYYRSCKTHLCNTGDGITKLPDRNSTDYDYYDEDNSGTLVAANPYVLIFAVIFPFYYFLATTSTKPYVATVPQEKSELSVQTGVL